MTKLEKFRSLQEDHSDTLAKYQMTVRQNGAGEFLDTGFFVGVAFKNLCYAYDHMELSKSLGKTWQSAVKHCYSTRGNAGAPDWVGEDPRVVPFKQQTIISLARKFYPEASKEIDSWAEETTQTNLQSLVERNRIQEVLNLSKNFQPLLDATEDADLAEDLKDFKGIIEETVSSFEPYRDALQTAHDKLSAISDKDNSYAEQAEIKKELLEGLFPTQQTVAEASSPIGAPTVPTE